MRYNVRAHQLAVQQQAAAVQQHHQQQQQQHQQQQQMAAVQLAVAAQKQAQDAHAALLRSLPRPPPQLLPVSLQQLGRPLHLMQPMPQHMAMPQLNMLRPPTMQFPPG